MSNRTEEKKVYQKPEMRQVSLSLAEVTLGTGCFAVAGDPEGPATSNCYPATSLCMVPV